MRRILERFDPSWPASIDVGEGWFGLLEELDARLAQIAPEYEVCQAKATFGALTFTARPGPGGADQDQAFTAAIEDAAWRSTRVCEECGGDADCYVIRLRVWTLCPTHATQKQRAGV